MKAKTRLVEYLLVTGVVWVYYAVLLPIYFYYVFHWNLENVKLWWITGTPVEFIIAYPLGKILWKLKDPIRQICDKVEHREIE